MRLIDADEIKFDFPFDDIERDDLFIFAKTFIAWIKKQIKDSPAIDAEPVRHGHWIDSQCHFTNLAIERKCSACGFVINVDKREMKYEHYCTMCGAKMDEEE